MNTQLSHEAKMVGVVEAMDAAKHMAEKMFKHMEAEGTTARDRATLSDAEFAIFRDGLKQQADKGLADAVRGRIDSFAAKGNHLGRSDLNNQVVASMKQSIRRAARGDNFISLDDRISTRSNLAEVAALAAMLHDQRSAAAVAGWETRRAQQVKVVAEAQ